MAAARHGDNGKVQIGKDASLKYVVNSCNLINMSYHIDLDLNALQTHSANSATVSTEALEATTSTPKMPFRANDNN